MEQVLLAFNTGGATDTSQMSQLQTAGNNAELDGSKTASFGSFFEEMVAKQGQTNETQSEMSLLTQAENIVASLVEQTTPQAAAENGKSSTLSNGLVSTQADTSFVIDSGAITNNTEGDSNLFSVSNSGKGANLILEIPAENATPKSILLKQIQQIIDEGENKGPVTIKGESTPSTMTSLESSESLATLSSEVVQETENDTIQIRQLAQTQLAPAEEKSPKSSSNGTESSRKEVTEQFINAKIGDQQSTAEEQRNSKQESSDSPQKNLTAQTEAGSITTNSAVDSTTGELGFGKQLQSTVSQTSTGNVEGKFSPGSTHEFQDKEIVDTVIQRFNVNPRLQTSKLTLQLHPAELGELKIDVLVKGDSISANIVAQSQHVFETLDKNMARLRTVLESQGFTIDSFDISVHSEGDKQQNLFQEHFESQQQFAENSDSQQTQTSDSFEALLSQEEIEPKAKNDQSVNVTA